MTKKCRPAAEIEVILLSVAVSSLYYIVCTRIHQSNDKAQAYEEC